MKARFYKNFGFGLVLSAMPFVGACNQASNVSPSFVTSAQAEPSPAVVVTNAAATNVPATPLAETPPGSAPATPAPDAGKAPLPPSINPSSAVAEIAKLAQSGVEENVILTYVTNSSKVFALTSDEIIYLNDIGVPNNVVTAMMQRDQELKNTWTQTAQPPSATTQPDSQAADATAPTYVNPPEAEQTTEVATAPPPTNVTYNYFYDTLSPYGTWIDIDGYGRCWQPTVVVVNSGWRPYCDRGRWLYTDAGWYWNSDYSWGWATFHYGRWFHHGRWGWCWYPDYVWAPSWVTWRYSNDYCGWAPLPPYAYYRPGFGFYYHNRAVGLGFDFGIGAAWFNFVPWRGFCDSRPWHHRVHGSRVTQIYNNTTVVNNIVNGDNNTIINRGVPVDHVRRHSGTEVRQVAIRETRNAPGRVGRGERLERDGRTLVVSRPTVQPADIAPTSTRSLRDSDRSRTAIADTTGTTQTESTRGLRRARPSAESRERTTQPQPVAPTTKASSRSTEPSVTAPTVRSSPVDGSNVSRNRNELRERSTRERDGDNRDNNRPAAPPAVVRNGERSISTPSAPNNQRDTTVNPPSAPKAPSSSSIVIGRRDSAPGNARPNVSEVRRPSRPENPVSRTETSSARTETPSRPTHTWSSSQTAPPSRPSMPPSRVERQESPRQVAPPSRSYSAPSHATPSSRAQSVSPVFSAPRSAPAAPSRPSPSYSAPAPSYSAPRSAPAAPVYSAPRSAPAPSPSPSFSAPRSAPSAPSFTPAPSRSSAPSAAPASPGRSDSGHGSGRRH